MHVWSFHSIDFCCLKLIQETTGRTNTCCKKLRKWNLDNINWSNQSATKWHFLEHSDPGGVLQNLHCYESNGIESTLRTTCGIYGILDFTSLHPSYAHTGSFTGIKYRYDNNDTTQHIGTAGCLDGFSLTDCIPVCLLFCISPSARWARKRSQVATNQCGKILKVDHRSVFQHLKCVCEKYPHKKKIWHVRALESRKHLCNLTI